MITMQDIERAAELCKRSAENAANAERDHNAAENAFASAYGIDYFHAGMLARRGVTDMIDARASVEGENVRATFERYQVNKRYQKTDETYMEMLVSCFKVQVRQIVGAALDARASEWVGKPAHYKRTHAVLVAIAQDALKAAGVDGIGVYVYDNGAKGVMHDTCVRFTCSLRAVDFKSSRGECVDMQVRMYGNRDHDPDTLYNENFTHWYGDCGMADALQIDAADVRRLARSYARDMKRIERENIRYNAAVSDIERKYAFMGVTDAIYKARLIAHN